MIISFLKLPFYVSVAATAASLTLSLVVFICGGIDQELQAEIQNQQQQLQKQQEQINTGNTISNEVGPQLLHDMALVSVKDEKMRQLLGRHGYTVNYQPPASSAPGASPATPPASSSPPAATPNLRL